MEGFGNTKSFHDYKKGKSSKLVEGGREKTIEIKTDLFLIAFSLFLFSLPTYKGCKSKIWNEFFK